MWASPVPGSYLPGPIPGHRHGLPQCLHAWPLLADTARQCSTTSIYSPSAARPSVLPHLSSHLKPEPPHRRRSGFAPCEKGCRLRNPAVLHPQFSPSYDALRQRENFGGVLWCTQGGHSCNHQPIWNPCRLSCGSHDWGLAGSSGYVSRMCSPSQRLAAWVFGPLLKPDCKRLVKDPLDCVCC